MSEAEPRCRLFDTVGYQWKPLSNCPWGDFLEVTQIDSGPGGWIAVHSSAEGAGTLRLAQYEPERGQRDTPAPDFNLYPMGSIQTHFSRDGTRIDISTNCRLEAESRPCEEQGEEENWRLYSWRLKEEKLVRVREGLPPHFVPAPGGDRLAWLSGERVCLSETEAVERRRCFCLPTSSPGTCKPE